MLDRFADPAGTHDVTIMIADREIRLREPNRPGGRWARVWPAALSLADTIATLDISNQRVLELGCGLGLPSVVAAQRGAIVTVTDVEPEAVEMAIENAQRAGVHVDGVVADWRTPDRLVEQAPFDLVIAADVVYFEYALDALTALLPRLVPPGGRAIVTAPADARTRGTSVFEVFGEQFEIDSRPDPERGELMVHRLRPVSRQWTGTHDT